jgi:UDP-N-acetylglucosamine 4-epimerase
MTLTVYQQTKEYLKIHPSKWLVTGVSGFIGSNLVEELLKLNQEVVGLDNFSTGFKQNLQDIENNVSSVQWKRFTFLEGDILDASLCVQACQGVEFVLHQAALGSVPRSIADPINSNSSNVTGFLNMLVAAKDTNVKRFIYAASSSTYGDHPALPKKEDITGKPLSPYAVTKLVNEIYADVFNHTYQLDSIGLRYFNVFGRRQAINSAYAAVIPEWVGSIINNQDVFINGDGSTSRDFTFIDNVVQANILSATSKNPDAINKIYNIAAGERTTLIELFQFISKNIEAFEPRLKPKKPIFRDFREGDVKHSLADISRAKLYLGYEPTHNVEQGIEAAVTWYLKNFNA